MFVEVGSNIVEQAIIEELDSLPEFDLSDPEGVSSLFHAAREKYNELGIVVPCPTWSSLSNPNAPLFCENPNRALGYMPKAWDSYVDDIRHQKKNVSLLGFPPGEFIVQTDQFYIAINGSPMTPSNVLFIPKAIQTVSGSTYEATQRLTSIQQAQLDELVEMSKHGIYGYCALSNGSLAYLHMHGVPDTYDGKKLPITQAIIDGRYDENGIYFDSEKQDSQMPCIILDKKDNPLELMMRIKKNGIDVDFITTAGKVVIIPKRIEHQGAVDLLEGLDPERETPIWPWQFSGDIGFTLRAPFIEIRSDGYIYVLDFQGGGIHLKLTVEEFTRHYWQGIASGIWNISELKDLLAEAV